tara:strand:- start:649 stop:1023 length:375 start_codon:yes stop_codon:yes gene_type:complete
MTTTTHNKEINELDQFGKLLLTAGISSWINEPTDDKEKTKRQFEIFDFYLRHTRFDYGNLSKDDIEVNNWTKENKDGGRLHSSYLTKSGKKVWIITSGYGQQHLNIQYKVNDFCYTTIMLPDEY